MIFRSSFSPNARQRALPFVMFALCATSATSSHAAPNDVPVRVTLEPLTVRSIGGVTKFDRAQFLSAHISPDDGEMTPAEFNYLENDLQVAYGRNGGLLSWQRKQAPADPKRPDFPDLDWIKRKGAEHRAQIAGKRMGNPVSTGEEIQTSHPELAVARPDNKTTAWGPRSVEGLAEFNAQFFKEYWSDANRPRYFEVFNEPFVHAKDFGSNNAEISRQFAAVARRMKEVVPDVKVGGYTAAYPELNANNFGHWQNSMKTFMDIAGPDMAFYSTHIYDHFDDEGRPLNRTGSNAEAIIDMIDAYGAITPNRFRPQIISEFGLIPDKMKRPDGSDSRLYSARRDALSIRSTNAQLMSFMAHPDRILKVVPFFLTKASWTYGTKGTSMSGTIDRPSPFLMWRKTGDGTRYVETEIHKYYEFWKGVNGQWRAATSSDPDVISHLIVDNTRVNAVMMNLEDDARTVKLSGLSDLQNVVKIELRTLKTDGDAPILEERVLSALPTQLVLAPGESAMIIAHTAMPNLPNGKVEESRIYATTYLQPIVENQAISFQFPNVPMGNGSALLRLGMGRAHGKSLQPILKVNGKVVPVPTDWRGDNQATRREFFGVIEVPIPNEILTANSVVELTFPDGDGHVSSAILQVERRSAV